MGKTHFIWLLVLAVGIVLGLFLKPRTVGIFVGGVLGLLFISLIVGAATGFEPAVWIAGVALMAAPILGLVLFLGAVLSNAAVAALKRIRK